MAESRRIRQTRSYLKSLFEGRGISPRTSFGQNFLVDLNLQELLVRAAELRPEDVVLEVGAGTGGLTAELAAHAGAVVAVELDTALAELAAEATAQLANVSLLQTDILKGKNELSREVLAVVRQRLAAHPPGRLKLVANLPFNVATPVITNLLDTDLPLVSMTVTVQQEVADRMLARPSTKDYGSLAVWVQSLCEIRLIRRLPPSVFWPRPKVSAAIVHVVTDPERRARIADVRFFHSFVRRIFLHRRKNLRGVLASAYRNVFTKPDADRFLAEHGHATTVRAEQLTVEQLIELANDLSEKSGGSSV